MSRSLFISQHTNAIVAGTTLHVARYSGLVGLVVAILCMLCRVDLAKSISVGVATMAVVSVICTVAAMAGMRQHEGTYRMKPSLADSDMFRVLLSGAGVSFCYGALWASRFAYPDRSLSQAIGAALALVVICVIAYRRKLSKPYHGRMLV
jgi:hypothetical protein